MAGEDAAEMARIIERLAALTAVVERMERQQGQRFRDLDVRLDSFVTHRVHDADLRGVSQRIDSVDRDITDLDRDQQRTEHIARTSRQWAVGVGVAALGVLIAAFTLLQSTSADGGALAAVMMWMVGGP